MNLFRHRDKPADWVIDSVIQYICSPIFSAPVLDFIEYRCVVFDSSEENKFSYTDAHQDFGKLIDYQLASFMNDTGINPNDFASALALDMNSHQGVNKNALKIAFKYIEAVENFLQFKSIMVSTNQELNSRALEMLARSGMLTTPPISQQAAARFSETPPPPYSDGYEEDGVRNLLKNIQEFEETVTKQQETTKHKIGIELDETRSQLDQLHFTEKATTPTHHTRLYPELEYSLDDPIQFPAIPVSTEITDLSTLDNILTDTSSNYGYTGLGQETFELEEQAPLTPVSVENKFNFPELPTQQKQQTITDTNKISPTGRDVEVVNEEINLLGTADPPERSQSPVEAANSLTQQWMQYAKQQQSMWRSMDACEGEKSKPSDRDLAEREEHFRRQRDLLRNQRKQERVAEQQITEATTTTQHIPSIPDGNPVDAEKEKTMAEEAKRFRRALSAKLKKEVINRPKH